MLWKSKITFMQSKWESITNTDNEGTRDHDVNVLMKTSRNLASKTPLGLARLPHPWGDSEDVATVV